MTTEGEQPGREPPYDELDPPIVPFVRLLNDFAGIRTIGSCGGHEEPSNKSAAPRRRVVGHLRLEPGDPDGLVANPSPDAWVSLEFLAYVVDEFAKRKQDILLVPFSPPPWLNFPGRTLRFALNGRRDEHTPDPDKIAENSREIADEYYVPAAESWPNLDLEPKAGRLPVARVTKPRRQRRLLHPMQLRLPIAPPMLRFAPQLLVRAQTFAPVRSGSLRAHGYAVSADRANSERTRTNNDCSHCSHGKSRPNGGDISRVVRHAGLMPKKPSNPAGYYSRENEFKRKATSQEARLRTCSECGHSSEHMKGCPRR